MIEQKIGIIDLGSNSIRLVIFKIEENGRYKELYNLKIIARLANYIEENGHISEEGIRIVIDALKQFEPIVKHHYVQDVKGIATAAIRLAKNGQEIINKIHEETMFHFQILSGEQEAYYGYLAVVNSINIDHCITIDIGGGSTEITYVKNRELIHSHSFPFGALTLKQMFITLDKPTDTEKTKLVQFLKDQFLSVNWIKNTQVPVIGIGGSARNLCRIHQSKTNYPLFGLHQYCMQPDEVTKVNEWLRSKTLIERQKLDGLSRDRADIIIPAITAISVLLDVVSTPYFMMSNKGLREGIFYEKFLNQFNTKFFPSVKNETLFQLSKDYEIDTTHTSYLLHLVRMFMNECKEKEIVLYSEEEKEVLMNSTKLVQFGEYIDKASSSQHTFYLLTNRSLDGFSHSLRLKVACVASFKSKATLNKYLAPYQSLLTTQEIKRLELLGAILKFLNALNYTKRRIISSLTIQQSDPTTIDILINCHTDSLFEKEQALKQKKHLERALFCKINVNFTLS